jgi:hypothetical protein
MWLLLMPLSLSASSSFLFQLFFPECCAQQTGIHEIGSNCLLSIYLDSELILIDIGKLYRPSILPVPYDIAGLYPVEVYEPVNRNRNAA